ncbi:Rid family detoxifying hydrolase [Ascidiimonas aurantiaca]|uniref:RidA family protein n=1 Tax=Ascidiimonas aurantiaca TaxID=1685432 RepID=UPI0030ED08CC
MKSIVSFCLLAVMLSVKPGYAQDVVPEFHESHIEQKRNAPFSDVVVANGFMFLAGQIGFDYTTGELAEGGIKEQTLQTIMNIKAVLEKHNASLDQVIKCTVILKNIEDFKAFNEVYVQYFPNKPARTTFAAAGLARDALIEIDCIAVK